MGPSRYGPQYGWVDWGKTAQQVLFSKEKIGVDLQLIRIPTSRTATLMYAEFTLTLNLCNLPEIERASKLETLIHKKKKYIPLACNDKRIRYVFRPHNGRYAINFYDVEVEHRNKYLDAWIKQSSKVLFEQDGLE
jgi:hypothetical protein